MTRREEIPSLTGLRGVAACSVLFSHALDGTFYYEPVVEKIAIPFAHFGMSLFFVLSGFVIHYNYGALFATAPMRFAAWRFFAARFARLYPLFAVSILCSLPTAPLPFSGWVALSYVTMTQTWFNTALAVFPPAWSISTEWFFYLAYVPLTVIARRIQSPMTVFFAFCIVVFVAFGAASVLWRDQVSAFAHAWFWHDDKVSADPWEWLVAWSPYVRVMEFVVGMLMAQAFKSGRPKSLPSIVLPAAIIWCGFVFLADWLWPLGQGGLVSAFIFAPAIALAMLYLCKHESWLASALSSRLGIFLGEISYSIYIWSFFVIGMLGQMFYQAPITLHYVVSALKIPVVCGMTLVFAYGSYHLIEIPARRFLRNVLTGSGS
jgi:peptidoglycan/LPS O-acetylase OafA/YrhL